MKITKEKFWNNTDREIFIRPRVGDCDETSQINKVDIFLHPVNYEINYRHDCVCRCIKHLIWIRKSAHHDKLSWETRCDPVSRSSVVTSLTTSISPRTRPHMDKLVWLLTRHLLFRNILAVNGIATIISSDQRDLNTSWKVHRRHEWKLAVIISGLSYRGASVRLRYQRFDNSFRFQKINGVY